MKRIRQNSRPRTNEQRNGGPLKPQIGPPVMTYDDAMAVLRKVPSAMLKGQRIVYGARVRHQHMGKGWSIFYISRGNAKGFYCLNPVTGSNYAFTPSDRDRETLTWKIVK